MPVSDERREAIWEALSDAFIDNEIDYRHIASQVADVPLIELKEIFFTEVAPYCGPNLMTPIPPVWAGFGRAALMEGIRAMQAGNRDSWIARMRHRCFVAFCRRYFRHVWQAIADGLGQ